MAVPPNDGDLPVTIGTLIRQAREACGVARAELAVFIGVSDHTMQRYEEGTSSPRMLEALAIAVRCGIHVQDLYPATLLDQLLRHVHYNRPITCLKMRRRVPLNSTKKE